MKQIKSDLIITGGPIYTLDESFPAARSVCTKEGRIHALPDNGNIDDFVGPNTKVIDLKGNVLIPGLHESHGHLLALGHSVKQISLIGCSCYEEMIDTIKESVPKYTNGQWIVGTGWQHENWKDAFPSFKGLPTNVDISKITDNPVILIHSSGHSLLANEKALEVIKKGTIKGTDNILKNEKGEPTGIFLETARSLFDRYIADGETNKAAVRAAFRECVSKGVTCFYDAASTLAMIETYREVLSKEQLRIRLLAMVHGRKESNLEDIFRHGVIIGAENGFLSVRSVKLFMDGALGTHTAWLDEPYNDREDFSGSPLMSVEHVEKYARMATDYHFQVCTHAIGDRANSETIGIYKQILSGLKENNKDIRMRIEHAQLLHDSHISDMAKHGIIAAVQPVQAVSDGKWMEKLLGPGRTKYAFRWQDMDDAGVMLASGSDTPVEDVSPSKAFSVLTQKNPINGSAGFSAQKAIKFMTINPAYAAFVENEMGSISIGKYADFVVVSNDVLNSSKPELNVLATIVNGEVLFENKGTLTA